MRFRIDLSSYTSALTGFLSFPSDTITPLSYPIAAVNYHTIPLARCLALALIVQLRALTLPLLTSLALALDLSLKTRLLTLYPGRVVNSPTSLLELYL